MKNLIKINTDFLNSDKPVNDRFGYLNTEMNMNVEHAVQKWVPPLAYDYLFKQLNTTEEQKEKIIITLISMIRDYEEDLQNILNIFNND